MNAAHFRNRAARARAMAQNGEDIRLSRMLLDVANELDAEADLIEAEARQHQADDVLLDNPFGQRLGNGGIERPVAAGSLGKNGQASCAGPA